MAALLAVSIAVAIGYAADDKSPFRPRPVGDYPHRQTSEGVTIAAEQFVTDAQAATAFGKLNPWRYGVLPVLLVIQNDSPNAIRLDKMRIYYTLPGGTRAEPTPGQEVKYLRGVKQPRPISGPRGAVPGRTAKNPLAEWEIEGREFRARMLPPGQTASGFFYFQAETNSEAASIYISGIEDAVKNQELYYFDIPLSGK
jgi:hypothetical protein